MKPVIFAAADTLYYKKFSQTFLKSARSHGMTAHVMHCGDVGRKACFLRWTYLPDLLKQYPAVLLLDIDSLIREPIEFDDWWDMGIFFRHDYKPEWLKVLCSAFYITDRAMDFAKELAGLATAENPEWMDDQRWVWALHQKHPTKYRIKPLDTNFINWRRTQSAIWTGKGGVKDTNWFNIAIKQTEEQ